MSLMDEIKSIGDRMERLLDAGDEIAEDLKELGLEGKAKNLPMKAIKELVQARRKDKMQSKRDHLADLVSVSAALDVDLGMFPANEKKIASVETFQAAAAE